jgi:hypothetical protein
VYSLRQHIIRLCIPIFSLSLLVGTMLLINPVAAYAHSSQSQNPLNIFSSSGIAGELVASGDYILKATEIIGTDAHMNKFPDPSHPTLTFTATTITGFSLSHSFYGMTLVLTSDGMVTATGVAIKTGLFKDINTGLQSFANKADLVVLAVGGTVKRLVMKNVTLMVDRFIDAATFVITSFHLVLATGTQQVNTTPSPAATPSPAVTPSPTVTSSLPQPKLTPTAISIPIPTPTPRSVPTPTPTPKPKCLCLLLCLC